MGKHYWRDSQAERCRPPTARPEFYRWYQAITRQLAWGRPRSSRPMSSRPVKPTSTFKFCDAVQSFGKIPGQFDDLHADMAILSAHKIGGLKGAGALVIRKGLDVAPLLKGGGQEQGRRSGTQNLIGIAAFGAAAESAASQVKTRCLGRSRHHPR